MVAERMGVSRLVNKETSTPEGVPQTPAIENGGRTGPQHIKENFYLLSLFIGSAKTR